MLKVCMDFYSIPHILIIGFGAQANAWALNLRDSGLEVSLCLNEDSPSIKKANNVGLKAYTYKDVDFNQFNFILLLTPDHTHLEILKSIEAKLTKNQTIVIAHGFSLHYQKLESEFSNLNFALLAPKAIASEVRFNYETKRPLAAVVDYSKIKFHKSSVEKLLKNIITSLGINVGPIESTFEVEAKADLFSEQTILCSLIPYGARFAFEKLLEKGIPADIAYIECWHEVKLIADAMIKVGPSDFFKMISPNALLGSQKAKDIFFNDVYFKSLEKIFNDINSEVFFEESQNCNFNELRNDISAQWSATKLQETYQNIGKQLGKLNP